VTTFEPSGASHLRREDESIQTHIGRSISHIRTYAQVPGNRPGGTQTGPSRAGPSCRSPRFAGPHRPRRNARCRHGRPKENKTRRHNRYNTIASSVAPPAVGTWQPKLPPRSRADRRPFGQPLTDWPVLLVFWTFGAHRGSYGPQIHRLVSRADDRACRSINELKLLILATMHRRPKTWAFRHAFSMISNTIDSSRHSQTTAQ